MTQFRRYGIARPDLEAEVKKLCHQYHTAIRDQKRKHWLDYLDTAENLWDAARYAKNGSERKPIPPLQITPEGESVRDETEKAKVLLEAFFPPTPSIEREETRELPAPLHMDPVSDEEIEAVAMSMNPWKAPGEDQIPAGVWQRLWSTVGSSICKIFRASIALGHVPSRWRIAKIIPLHKPERDWSRPNSYRPISLLSTLGKILEAVIAQRLSYLTETYSLLPPNHFGARRKRSSEQALNVLMERIHEAWRRNQVLSVVSFDVKGAYNGVAKEVLIHRLQQRRVPTALVQWIDAFCSHRRAMIVINDHCSEAMEITCPGLPQGSPLSPILYLFFNADLVDVPINKLGGAIAFVDDYNRWVVGPSADVNAETIQEHVIPKALSWAAKSGATFEAQKTQYIHFTRNTNRNPQPAQPLKVDKQKIAPSNAVKLLGVICDQKLKFREHIGRATKRGIQASQALMRLRGLRPQNARQLYQSLVVSTITYAASVWATVNKHGNIPEWIVKPMDVIQKTTAKVVVGLFRTVSRSVAEAEAGIIPLNIYLQKRILRHWINCHSLPNDHPIRKCLQIRGLLTSKSPFGKLTQVLPLHQTRVEPISPYIACPWESEWKNAIVLDEALQENPTEFDKPKIQVYTYGSARNGLAGFGIAVMMGNAITQSTSRTIEIQKTLTCTMFN
ncbi:hypothetical protein N7474_005069 [Penicillium riverlandense]|uniref:uncharacterized protein n=1 Tax=Penicillium riverlandense TaxID=1903569 RepID=UPI002548FD89|nr:uncharacterized protein N7474_005069 [Penicillium riverlandense]KAJ5819478.1 hypothetical protein N7474_005069 [Penicillium riverlandense]